MYSRCRTSKYVCLSDFNTTKYNIRKYTKSLSFFWIVSKVQDAWNIVTLYIHFAGPNQFFTEGKLSKEVCVKCSDYFAIDENTDMIPKADYGECRRKLLSSVNEGNITESCKKQGVLGDQVEMEYEIFNLDENCIEKIISVIFSQHFFARLNSCRLEIKQASKSNIQYLEFSLKETLVIIEHIFSLICIFPLIYLRLGIETLFFWKFIEFIRFINSYILKYILYDKADLCNYKSIDKSQISGSHIIFFSPFSCICNWDAKQEDFKKGYIQQK